MALLMRNHQCNPGMLYSWRVSGWFLIGSGLDPRRVHEVFEIDRPTQHHLQRQRKHRQKQQHGDAVTHEIQLRIKSSHHRLGENAGQRPEVKRKKQYAGKLTLECVANLNPEFVYRLTVPRDELWDL